MPQFILEGRDEPDFQALDAFTQGYIEAAFFCGVEDPSDDTGNTDADVDFTDLAPEALASMIEDCRDFQESNAVLLTAAYENGATPYDETFAGHDFWLTRNHHGAGFWDRGLGIAGDNLTDMAHAYGDCDLYLGDDGRVYVM